MDTRKTPLTGIGLRLARALLVLSALALLLLWIASLPEYLRRASTLSIPTYERAGVVLASNDMIVEAAARRGLSLSSYPIYETALDLLSIGVFFGVAGLLVWRAKRSWLGWLTALVFMGIGATGVTPVLHVVRPSPGVLAAVEAAGWLVWPVMFLWLYLFPSGGAALGWTRTPVGIVLACLGALAVAGFLAELGILPAEAGRPLSQVGPVLALGVLGLIVYSQIYRYRRVYSSVEREQVKWVVFAALILLADIILYLVTGLLRIQVSAIFQDFSGKLVLLLPLAVGVAVLRYRLYDIDLILNRTLVYVPLTAIVAGLIAAGVKLSQTAFIAITGKESDVAVVAATFFVVSLSTPIRNRLQALVDRYFKESGDVERRLQPFTERVSGVIEVLDRARIAERFVEECVGALGARGGALYRLKRSRRSLVFKSEGWRDKPQLEVGIPPGSDNSGILYLSDRKSGAPYSAADRRAVETLARVMALALGWKSSSGPARERKRSRGKAAPAAWARRKTTRGERG